VTLRTFGACAAVLLLANTAYIAAAASPTVFYMGNVLAHVVVGATVWIAALALIVRDRAFRGSWPDRPARQPPRAAVSAHRAHRVRDDCDRRTRSPGLASCREQRGRREREVCHRATQCDRDVRSPRRRRTRRRTRCSRRAQWPGPSGTLAWMAERCGERSAGRIRRSSPHGGGGYQSSFAPNRMMVGPMIVTGKR
jgi:hypothetical protein